MHLFNHLKVVSLIALPLVASVAIDLEKRAPAVSVTLSSVGGSVVKAVIKNNAEKDLTLLKSGSFLDSAPVEKATVSKNGKALLPLLQNIYRRSIPQSSLTATTGDALPFEGVLLRTLTKDLTEDAFTTLAAGETAESTFDLAKTTDLSEGGTFDVLTEGAFAVASDGSTDLSNDKASYKSNKLSIKVDGAAAARVAPAIRPLDRRTIVSSCSGTRNTALRNALPRVVSLSNAAANAALNNNAKFVEYFKTSTSSAKNTVAARFRAVAAEAGRTTSGRTRYYCTDPYGYCSPNVLAYSKSSSSPPPPFHANNNCAWANNDYQRSPPKTSSPIAASTTTCPCLRTSAIARIRPRLHCTSSPMRPVSTVLARRIMGMGMRLRRG